MAPIEEIMPVFLKDKGSLLARSKKSEGKGATAGGGSRRTPYAKRGAGEILLPLFHCQRTR